MTIREDRHGNVVQASRPYLTYVLAVGASSVASPQFNVNPSRPIRNVEGSTQPTTLNHTRHIRIVCTVASWVAFGNSPVAIRQGGSSMYMPAGLPEYFWVIAGEQVAVTQDATGGFCYITELYN